MNVSREWLRSLAPDLELSAEQMAEQLAGYGAAVDEIVDVGAGLEDIVIARVLEAGRHPNADRLSLCVVDAGGEQPLQVVCGAPNVRAGATYPFIPVGGTLPGGMQIRKAKIRGSESQGMLCSARELGLGRDHEGILELHGTFAPGQRFLDAVGLRDTRLVLDITPNRPDLLSHWGVARELAAGGQDTLVLPPFPDASSAGAGVGFVTGSPDVQADGIRVTVEDPAGCLRYYGIAVRGVRVAPSPEWLASRLRAVGVRPINNVVDATNYILHELGQPLHAFDLNRLGSDVVIRRARAGESLVTLDGRAHALTPASLVIADPNRPVALAGVMGGLETEVVNDTTDLLLECALFDPRITRDTRRAAGLTTDASVRFERGVDPSMMETAVRRALDLIVTIAGGTPAGAAPVVDTGVAPLAPIRLRTTRVTQVLGEVFDADQIVALLEPIGFRTRSVEGGLSVLVPGHRRYDVAREVDLIEEIARRHGFDRFPQDLRPFRPSSVPDDVVAALENQLRERFVGRGFLECRTAPFAAEDAGDVALLLPLSAAESRLRRDLVSGLLRRAEFNFNRGARSLRLFEIGTVFATGGNGALPAESTHIAAVLTGAREPGHWSGSPAAHDLWDLRGLLEMLCERLGLVLSDERPRAPWELGWTLSTVDGTRLGAGGQILQAALDAPRWADAVFAFELRLMPAMATAEPVAFTPLPSHPPVERDLALALPRSAGAGAVEATIRASGGPLLEDVRLFDVFADARLGSDRRSLAFRLRFRAPDRTLVDAEVDRALAGILERLVEEHGAERRA